MWIVWEWTQTLKLLKIMKTRPQLLRLRRTRIYIFWKHPNEVNILKKIYGEKDTLESIFWRSCSENHETLVVRQNKTNFQRSRHPRNEEISPRASLHNFVSPQLVYFGTFLKTEIAESVGWLNAQLGPSLCLDKIILVRSANVPVLKIAIPKKIGDFQPGVQ